MPDVLKFGGWFAQFAAGQGATGGSAARAIEMDLALLPAGPCNND
jgi:hypothetical protein